jgi:lysyl endopeptidase
MVFLLLFAFAGTAQISFSGSPLYDAKSSQSAASTFIMPLINASKLKTNETKENPLYSIPVTTNLTLDNSGEFTNLENGDRVWHLEIASPQGKSIALFYENFYLPVDAKLFFFDKEKTQIKGAYTSANNKESGKFFTGFIHSETAILEYYEPANVIGEGHFTIFRIDQSIESTEAEKSVLLDLGFGTSSECHVNVNCTEGDEYQQEKQGICRIMMTVEEGTAWCSGTLINNIRNDETPYVLSAFHCTDGYTPMHDLWRFDFNYEAENCVNPTEEPEFQSVVGCALRAGRQETDFQLLEISQNIPNNFNVYFNGWDRSADIPSEATLLHHPSADIKKVSHDNSSLIIHPNIINWNNEVSTPANYHFRSVLDVGTFEIGSSGCPILDENKRVVAQLHGGNPGCADVTIYGGRLHYSWEDGDNSAEQLAPWLDPDNTEAEFSDALIPVELGNATVSGKITTQFGGNVAGVTVRANGDDVMSTLTDVNGNYALELPIGGQYTIAFEKDYYAENGVATSDIIKMRRVILNIEDYDNPYSIMAADANGTNTNPATSDIVVLRQMILNSIDIFPNNVPSWRFVPSLYEFPDETNPWSETIPTAIFINDLQEDILNVNIIGLKMGDVNGSADPAE